MKLAELIELLNQIDEVKKSIDKLQNEEVAGSFSLIMNKVVKQKDLIEKKQNYLKSLLEKEIN